MLAKLYPMMPLCPCGSQLTLNDCCGLYINLVKTAPTAEALMRSRYTAYTLHDADYIYNTTAPKERRDYNKKDILTWAKGSTWLKLEILYTSETIVEFKAYFLNNHLQAQVHHERSVFVKIDNVWYFQGGTYPS